MVAAGRIPPKTSQWDCRDLTPTGDVGHVDAGADHIAEHRSRLIESDFDAAQRFSSLRADVVSRSRTGCPGHRYVRPDPDRAGIADGRLEIGSGRDKDAVDRHPAKLGERHRLRSRIS
jgi:hypothetical protein